MPNTQNMQVKKRSGSIVDFDPEKIKLAISKAYVEVYYKQNEELATQLTHAVILDITTIFDGRTPGVEDVQNSVERKLMEQGLFDVAKAYIIYRYEHTKIREEKKQEVLRKIETRGLMVLKRSGQKEAFSPEKLRDSLHKLLGELAGSIDVDKIVRQVQLEVYEDMPTVELERAVIMTLRAFIENDTAYSFGAARALLLQIYKGIIGAEAISKGKLAEELKAAFPRSIARGVASGRLDSRLLQFNLEKLAEQLDQTKDYIFHYLGTQTLADRYLLKDPETKEILETPQFFWMRVAMGVALREEHKEERAVEFYRIMSALRYVPSSPTLFNSGLIRSQLSSCFINTVPDDLEKIFKSYADNSQLLKYTGGCGTDWTPVRGTGAIIKATNVESQGVIPFLKIANDVTISINRSGRRRGAACVYLESWHWDIEEFLELRKNTGDERRRTHDINTANWIPDLFMQRVQADSTWSLFSPDETPDLHDLYGAAFARRYEQYEAKGRNGELQLFREVKARDLWKKMLSMLFETGHPWITFKDPSNIRSPQDHTGVVHSSNLCTEITLNTSVDETAVCNLGSVNLARHIVDGQLDMQGIAEAVEVGIRMLDNVIDINFYPTQDAQRSNLRHRPVGLGIMGFHDALYQMGITFDSDAMVAFADESMEAISYHAILGSSKLAKERGSYASYRGSKWDRNILPQDTMALLEAERGQSIPVPKGGKLNWEPVRKHIADWGMRNSNCMAIAPTATICNISGAIPSIEPIYKNIYVKSNISGDFVVINHYLVADLKARGLWNQDMLSKLKFYDGRVTEIPEVPQDLKDKYKEVFEVDPKWMIKAAAYRGKWIDQSQSLNIFYSGKSGKEINDMYVYAWEMGLKTTYYLRTLAASQVEKSTVSTAAFGSTHTRTQTSAVADNTPPVMEPELVAVAVSAAAPAMPASDQVASAVKAPVQAEAIAMQKDRATTIKVEATPLTGAGALAMETMETNGAPFKLCRLEDPSCEACQ